MGGFDRGSRSSDGHSEVRWQVANHPDGDSTLRFRAAVHWRPIARGCLNVCRERYSDCFRSRSRRASVLAVTGLLAVAAVQAEPFSLRVAFGYGDDPPDRWAGSIGTNGARIDELGGWLFASEDRIELDTFELVTRHPTRPEATQKGLVVRGSADPGARLDVSSQHGDFSFRLDELSAGNELVFLDGWVRVSGLLGAEKLTDDSRFDDYPSVAVAANGAAWLVWQSYSGGRDEVRIRKFDKSWRTFSRVPGVTGDVWRPQVALAAGGRPWVVWSQQSNGNFDLYARELDEATGRWGDLVRLSSHPSQDIEHHLVADSRGWLWVVWQGFRAGNADIFLRFHNGAQWSREIQLSDHPANDWEPRIAIDRQGSAVVVWDSYRNGNYDVFLRRFAGGELGPLVPVATTAKFEAHASVAVDLDGRVWVAWNEGAANWGKDSGPTTDPGWIARGRELWTTWINQPSSPGARLYESRKVNLAVFEGGRRMVPRSSLADALEGAGIPDHDFPQLHVDPATGRVALLFHRWNHVRWTESLGFRPTYWEHAVVFFEGERWSAVRTMPESWGRISARADAAFGPDGSLTVVWPTDGRLEQRPVREVRANILAGRLGPADGPVSLELVPSAPGDPTPSASVHPRESADVAAIRAYRTSIRGTENRIVRGDLHRHSEFSWDSSGGMVDGSVFDFYRYMLDAAAMDFGAVTDHNSGGDSEYWWWLGEKSSDLFHIGPAFTTLYGYERSVAYPNGHRNIFHTRRGVPVVSFHTKADFDRPRPTVAAGRDTVLENDTKLLYESLRRSGGISVPHTTASNMGTDWRDNDPEVEPVVEVFQGDRVSYEHPGAPRAPRSAADNPIGGYQEDGFLWNAYRKGYMLGMIASSDHWSTHISYAMVYTEAPTRAAIFDAIKQRRTYGATDNIILEYRLGEHFMGEAFAAESIPPLQVRVEGTGNVARVEVIRNERVVYATRPNRPDVSVVYTDNDPPPARAYYYVRVAQDDGEIAWGSPIWVERLKSP